MSGTALSIAKARITSMVFGFCLLVFGTAQGQTININSHAPNEVITIFTPGGAVPPAKLIDISAVTTGSVDNVHIGLNGTITDNDWISGATGAPGIEDSPNSGLYVTSLDLTQATLFPLALNPLTLQAFAIATGASGYANSSTSYLDFDASDSVPILLNILPTTLVDTDGNGIPDADQISDNTSFSGQIVDLQFQPDPTGLPNYYVERRVESLEDFNAPSGLTFHTKSFVIDFQIYTITIALPNVSWFKTNRASDPDIAGALNMVLVTRAEQNPNFILDNNTTNTNTDSLFGTYPNVDPPAEFATQFGDAVDVPTIYFNITVLVEVSAGVWRELSLSSTAPMFVKVTSVGLNGLEDLNLYRYPTTTIQSTDQPSDIFQVGDGFPWSIISQSSSLEPGLTSTSFDFGEFIQGALYAASVVDSEVIGPVGGGGGGGGGCFIATAVYGTPMADEVESLRDFRDTYLMSSPIGASFVDIYYRLSPGVADYIAGNALLRAVVRAVLAPIVWLTQAFLMAPGAVMGTLAGVSILLVARRRVRKVA